jgi:hypothetical protein
VPLQGSRSRGLLAQKILFVGYELEFDETFSGRTLGPSRWLPRNNCHLRGVRRDVTKQPAGDGDTA